MGTKVPAETLRPPEDGTRIPEEVGGMADTPVLECGTTACYYNKGFSFAAESLKYEKLRTQHRNDFPTVDDDGCRLQNLKQKERCEKSNM